MRYLKIHVGSTKDLALQYLLAVKLPKIFKDQITDIDSCQSWWIYKTTCEFVDRVTKEYNTLKQLVVLPNEYQIKQEQTHSNSNTKYTEQPNQCNQNQPENRPTNTTGNLPQPNQ